MLGRLVLSALVLVPAQYFMSGVASADKPPLKVIKSTPVPPAKKAPRRVKKVTRPQKNELPAVSKTRRTHCTPRLTTPSRTICEQVTQATPKSKFLPALHWYKLDNWHGTAGEILLFPKGPQKTLPSKTPTELRRGAKFVLLSTTGRGTAKVTGQRVEQVMPDDRSDPVPTLIFTLRGKAPADAVLAFPASKAPKVTRALTEVPLSTLGCGAWTTAFVDAARRCAHDPMEPKEDQPAIDSSDLKLTPKTVAVYQGSFGKGVKHLVQVQIKDADNTGLSAVFLVNDKGAVDTWLQPPRTERLFDAMTYAVLDLDDDGQDEVFVVNHTPDHWEYMTFSRQDNHWWRVQR